MCEPNKDHLCWKCLEAGKEVEYKEYSPTVFPGSLKCPECNCWKPLDVPHEQVELTKCPDCGGPTSRTYYSVQATTVCLDEEGCGFKIVQCRRCWSTHTILALWDPEYDAWCYTCNLHDGDLLPDQRGKMSPDPC